MGSSYFGEPNLGGNERSARKGKKSNSDKQPKQPQRGLGVAQLEKIRLHSQIPSNYLPNSHLHTTIYPTTLNQEDMRQQMAYSHVPSSSSSSNSYGFHGLQNNNIMMGWGERTNVRYGDSQPSTTARWDNPGNGNLEIQHFAQPSMTRHLLMNLQVEDSLDDKRKKDRSNSMGSSSQNSGSSDNQELDLELRLSL
ncbi:protein SPEAR1-like [Cornus florida]|uniref:protein SPEAR1-like n=1 Tax=Cornus florida TaxID=4283 RepID=UPI00289CC58E|nr:protein SPEAR1-like [Cornus florida]